MSHPSHFANSKAHHAVWRYGIPIYLVVTLVLLLVSDIGSGITAWYTILESGIPRKTGKLIEESIFTSVGELWRAGSYPLAILVVLTSVAWPYVKLILTFLCWVLPYKDGHRRELFITLVDVLDKWSFVDIFVLVVIIVSFRSTIIIGFGVTMEVIVKPEWGFYGFVLANMMSLLATHVTLYRHRLVLHRQAEETSHGECRPERRSEEAQPENGSAENAHPDKTDEPPELDHVQNGNGNENGAASGPFAYSSSELFVAAHQDEDDKQFKRALVSRAGMSPLLLILLLVAGLVLHVVACFLDLYEVKNSRGEELVETLAYSIVSLGKEVPNAADDENEVGIIWIQYMWFFLVVALPIWTNCVLAIMFLVPMTISQQEYMFFIGEVTYAWTAVEVMAVSIIFAVQQMPTFGDGLNTSGCDQCYTVDTKMFVGPFLVLAFGAVLNVSVAIWLYRKAHGVLSPPIS